MTSVEQEIIAEVGKLDIETQQRILDYIRTLQVEPVKTVYTARELLKLPSQERQRLVAQAFDLAAIEDFEVFEAYSEEALDD